jgi:hypothetical protein
MAFWELTFSRDFGNEALDLAFWFRSTLSLIRLATNSSSASAVSLNREFLTRFVSFAGDLVKGSKGEMGVC